MNIKLLLSKCYFYESKIKSIRIIARSLHAKEIISTSNDVLLHSVTLPVQKVFENTELSELEVEQFGIDDEQTLFILCN